VAQMLFASGTAAVGIAARATDGDEAGSQDGAFGLELFLAGLKEAADQGGVFRNFHTFTTGEFSGPLTDWYSFLSDTSLKSSFATTLLEEG